MKFTYFKIFSILSVIISLSSCSKTDLVNTEIATVIPKQGSSFTFTNVHYDTNGVETYRTNEVDTVVTSATTFINKSNVVSVVTKIKNVPGDPTNYSYETNGDISSYFSIDSINGLWYTFPVSTQKESTFLFPEYKDSNSLGKSSIKFFPGIDSDIKVGNETISTKQVKFTNSSEYYRNNKLVYSSSNDNVMNFSKKIGYIVRLESIESSPKGNCIRTLISYSLK